MKYILFSLLHGMFIKIYYDLNDNNIYKYLGIKNKNYINEYLKGLFYIFLALISTKYPLYTLFYGILFILGFVFDRNAYKNPYEYSGTLIVITLIFLLNYESINNKILYSFVGFTLFIILGSIIFEYYLVKNVEFSNVKLLIRSISSFSLISFLLFNNYFNLVPTDIIIIIYSLLGYLITSCFFQIFLLNKKKLFV